MNEENQRLYSSAVSLPGQTPDYDDDYQNERSDIFSYFVYDEADKTIWAKSLKVLSGC